MTTVEDILNNKDFNIEAKTISSQGIVHATRTAAYTSVKKSLNVQVERRESKNLENGAAHTYLTVSNMLDDTLYFSDPNPMNLSVRAFSQQINGDVDNKVAIVPLPAIATEMSFMESAYFYIYGDINGKVFITKDGKETHRIGVWCPKGAKGSPAFKIKDNHVAFLSGPKQITFIRDLTFAPSESQTIFFINDVDVEGGILEVFPLSGSEFAVVGTEGEVVVYTSSGDIKSKCSIPPSEGNLLPLYASITQDCRYLLINCYNMETGMSELHTVEISEDLESKVIGSFQLPGKTESKFNDRFGAFEAGLSVEGNPFVLVPQACSKYDVKTRTFTGKLIVLGINDGGALEKLWDSTANYRWTTSLANNGKNTACIATSYGEFLLVTLK